MKIRIGEIVVDVNESSTKARLSVLEAAALIEQVMKKPAPVEEKRAVKNKIICLDSIRKGDGSQCNLI